MHDVRYDRRGFTLIELLVVMAIIAVFLGVLGVALSGGNSSVATQSAQRTLAGLVTGARGQAILKQADVRLIVHNDPPEAGDPPDVLQEKKERYLRYIGIVVLQIDPAGNRTWVPLNEGVYLPKGIYVVPPVDLDPASSEADTEVISDQDSDWLHDRRSVVSENTFTDLSFNSGLGNPDDEQNYFYIEFNGRGMITTDFRGNEGRLVVAPALETPTVPKFEDGGDNNVLGGVLRRYGSITMVHEPAAFPDYQQPAP